MTIRENIECIKQELGKGRVAVHPRNTGKTTALLEFVHEHAGGLVYIVTCNTSQAKHISKVYGRLFPDDDKPVVLSINNLTMKQIYGRPRCWVSDEVWPEAVCNALASFQELEYLGGVGSAISMDIHSGDNL